MSYATRCNRCGKFQDGHNFRINHEGRYGVDWLYKEYDLCPECNEDFFKFMNGAKPSTLREVLRDRLRRKD